MSKRRSDWFSVFARISTPGRKNSRKSVRWSAVPVPCLSKLWLKLRGEQGSGLFLLMTIAFLTGHLVARYVRSLAPLTPLTCSAALHFATLASLAHSVHRLAHSLRSLPRGTVEIYESVFTLKSRFMGTNAILVITRNAPKANETKPLKAKETESAKRYETKITPKPKPKVSSKECGMRLHV